MTELADEILAAPAGVALLGRLEARHFLVFDWTPAARAGSVAVATATMGEAAEPDARIIPTEVPNGSSPASVDAAVRDARSLPIDELLTLAVEAGYSSAGPWSGSSEVELVRAYRDAPARAAIAEVVAERFDEVGVGTQHEWWTGNTLAEGYVAQRCFENLDDALYDSGQFTFNGVRTMTEPPRALHQALSTAWELYPDPISRWRLPVRDDARVYEINQPSDWVDLVMAYPTIPTRPASGWELPGMNDHNRPPELAGVSSGRAARNEMDHIVMPQWSRVAGDFDGVHLSWRGWLTSEGFVSDTPDGGVTMLRYWFSEQTLWLNDVFGEPEPLFVSDDARRARDRDVLRAMLGR